MGAAVVSEMRRLKNRTYEFFVLLESQGNA